jgi:hypothetical protein
MAADNSTGGGFDWGQFFSGVENTVLSVVKTTTQPTAPPGYTYTPQGTLTPLPGSIPATTSALAGNAGLFLLLGFGLIAVLLLKK